MTRPSSRPRGAFPRVALLGLAAWLWLPHPAAVANAFSRETAQAQAISEQIPWTELLGPLAPIALSPFFGITCLSGCALLAERGLLPENQFLLQSEALRNPAVFAFFLCLTLLTSLPRLSKVSKPLAQAMDGVETYAGLITVVALHYLARHGGIEAASAVAPLGAGVMGQGGDLLLAAVSAANVLVIHAVRFFFELLVWLSPVPLLDALFEPVNKSVCAGLVMIYALHPTLALTLNTLLFLACLCMLRWTHRKTVFYRELFLRPLLGRVGRRFGFVRGPSWPVPLPGRLARALGGEPQGVLPVFPSTRVGAIPRHARCYLVKMPEGSWLLYPRVWGAFRKEPLGAATGRARSSFLFGTVEFESLRLRLLFSASDAPHLPELGPRFGWEVHPAQDPALPSSFRSMARDLSGALREARRGQAS